MDILIFLLIQKDTAEFHFSIFDFIFVVLCVCFWCDNQALNSRPSADESLKTLVL